MRQLTNEQMIQRLRCFRGKLEGNIPSGQEESRVYVDRKALIAIMREAGKDNPAPCQLRVRGRVGYIIPMRGSHDQLGTVA